MAVVKDRIEALQHLLRGELAAVETYGEALKHVDEPPIRTELERIREEHRTAAGILKTWITEAGGDADVGSGSWGAFAKLVEKAAGVVSPSNTLGSLREGEEHGAELYRSALSHDRLEPDWARTIEAELLPAQQRHVAVVERLREQREAAHGGRRDHPRQNRD